MKHELKIIDEFETASRSKYGSHAYACGYLSVMLAEAISRLPEHAQKIMLDDLKEKTVQFQGA